MKNMGVIKILILRAAKPMRKRGKHGEQITSNRTYNPETNNVGPAFLEASSVLKTMPHRSYMNRRRKPRLSPTSLGEPLLEEILR